MKQPLLKDDAFLEDVAAARNEGGQFHLWWLGQSGFLLQWQQHHALLDPYLSDSLTRKYEHTDKPHVRVTSRVIAPERLAFIDVASSSHNHTDHLDAETLIPLFKATPNLDLVIPEANRGFVSQRLGLPPGQPRGLDAGLSLRVSEFTFHAVPAAHNELHRDEQGRHPFLGYVIEFGCWRVYHSGDTLLYPGMEDWLRPWKIDVALLPINGNKPERRVAGNLDGRQAAALAKHIGARLVIPCHFDMFEFNTADPAADFLTACRDLAQPCRILRNGERWSSHELDPPQVLP